MSKKRDLLKPGTGCDLKTNLTIVLVYYSNI